MNVPFLINIKSVSPSIQYAKVTILMKSSKSVFGSLSQYRINIIRVARHDRVVNPENDDAIRNQLTCFRSFVVTMGKMADRAPLFRRFDCPNDRHYFRDTAQLFSTCFGDRR